MAIDVQPINASGALAAARLNNIPTGRTTLLASHTGWLDTVVKNLVTQSPNPWVDLFGYASHLGDPVSNKRLSDNRCEEVMNYIRRFNPGTLFPQEFGYGDSKSTGGPMNDDGQWRAVEVYVYGSLPPGKKARPAPVTLTVPKDWFVTSFSGSTMSVVVGAGFTAITGNITFEKPNGDKYTGPVGIIGPSVGLSVVPGASSLASKLSERFPVFTNFIFKESTALSNDFMKWLMSSNSIVAKLLWNSPLLNNAINALKKIIGGTGVAAEPWWSRAIGIVYGSRGRELKKADFAGSCLCYAVTGTVAVGGGRHLRAVLWSGQKLESLDGCKHLV
jgi:hypothetical protein